jgi:hypothetical protein
LAGVQVPPSVHVAQPPSWQTPPPPQEVPFGRVSCVAAQTEMPVEQLVAYVWQALEPAPPLHEMPGTHETHVPELHTWKAPHTVPLGKSLLVSTHAGPSAVQAMVPWWQGLAGVHAPPEAHPSPDGASTGPESVATSASASVLVASIVASAGASTVVSIVASTPVASAPVSVTGASFAVPPSPGVTDESLPEPPSSTPVMSPTP